MTAQFEYFSKYNMRKNGNVLHRKSQWHARAHSAAHKSRYPSEVLPCKLVARLTEL